MSQPGRLRSPAMLPFLCNLTLSSLSRVLKRASEVLVRADGQKKRYNTILHYDWRCAKQNLNSFGLNVYTVHSIKNMFTVVINKEKINVMFYIWYIDMDTGISRGSMKKKKDSANGLCCAWLVWLQMRGQMDVRLLSFSSVCQGIIILMKREVQLPWIESWIKKTKTHVTKEAN